MVDALIRSRANEWYVDENNIATHGTSLDGELDIGRFRVNKEMYSCKATKALKSIFKARISMISTMRWRDIILYIINYDYL